MRTFFHIFLLFILESLGAIIAILGGVTSIMLFIKLFELTNIFHMLFGMFVSVLIFVFSLFSSYVASTYILDLTYKYFEKH